MEQGNVLPEELAVALLSELDGLIQSDIMLLAPEEIITYDNAEQELILKPPHDMIYVHYLVGMIRQFQQEFEAYNNSQEIINEKLSVFETWYADRYQPARTLAKAYGGGTSAGFGPFAYLSAYGTAVKLGYQGTEAEWLESLVGAPGEAAVMRYNAETGWVQWGVGGVWTDLVSLEEIRGPVIEQTLAQLREARDQAVDAAAAAEAAKNGAGISAGTAASSAAEAKGFATTAQTSAESAGGSAQRAVQAQTAAEDAAGEARVAAATVGDAVAQHNASPVAHQDIRYELQKLVDYVTKLLNSDDETLDQMSEIVDYIKSNRELIAVITTSKVSVADIVNDLESNVSDRPLSAGMGAQLKIMFEQVTGRLGVSSADAGDLTRVRRDGGIEPLGIGESLEVRAGKLEVKDGGSGSGGLTTAQIDALNGMFRAAGYDGDAAYSAAYAAFQAAFGLTEGGDGPGGDSGGGEDSGGSNAGASNETTWTDGVAYTYALIDDEFVRQTGEIKAYDGWQRTPYLYCAGAALLEFTNPNSQMADYNAFFDADKVYVASFRPATTGSVEVPDTAVYFACSGPESVMADFGVTPRGVTT